MISAGERGAKRRDNGGWAYMGLDSGPQVATFWHLWLEMDEMLSHLQSRRNDSIRVGKTLWLFQLFLSRWSYFLMC